MTTTTKVFVDRFPVSAVPTLCLLRRRVHLSRELTDDVVRARAFMKKTQHDIGYYAVETRFDGVGFLRAWNDNGVMWYEYPYVNGKKNGDARHWASNGSGTLKERMPFVNDKQHGLWQRWYDDGTPLQELHYVHGISHGRARWWHRNGILGEEMTFNNGVRHGRARWWREDGSLEQEVEYDHGVIID